MLIDLHCHTFPLSDDSFLSPDQLIERAKAVGLDGVCLTEHDSVWQPHKLRELKAGRFHAVNLRARSEAREQT